MKEKGLMNLSRHIIHYGNQTRLKDFSSRSINHHCVKGREREEKNTQTIKIGKKPRLGHGINDSTNRNIRYFYV